MAGDIFYTQVDPSLVEELKARGKSGFRRSEKDLDFMLGKIANVQMMCYKGTDRKTPIIDSLIGGKRVLQDEYFPSSENGYLNSERSVEVINNISIGNVILSDDQRTIEDVKLNLDSSTVKNKANRIPPIIKQANITIVDNSRGLLNKATIQINIPNPELDLDRIERYWFRPGRFAQIIFEHPDSAVITGARLTSGSLPPSETILKNYPDLDYEKLRKMNRKDFEGNITSFDFSYQQDGSIDATIYLTGTSNVYTDISMYIPKIPETSDDSKEKKEKTGNIEFGYTYDANTGTRRVKTKEERKTIKQEDVANEFFDDIQKAVDSAIADSGIKDNGIIRAKGVDNTVTDQWILWGEDFSKTKKPKENQITDQYKFVTLGYLINYLNETILSRQLAVPNAKIICDDKTCFSNYYKNIVSADPYSILLTGDSSYYPRTSQTIKITKPSEPVATGTGSATPATGSATPAATTDEDLRVHPTLFFEKAILNSSYQEFYQQYDTNSQTMKAYPSRIFISLPTIKSILLELDDIDIDGEKPEGTDLSATGVQIKDFIAKVSARINVATGGAVSMKLITHPSQESVLIFYDSKYIGTPIQKEQVVPFNVPMFANHPDGTVVKEFNIKATLGGRAKQLAYVLQGTGDVSEADIAPFLRFMYVEGGDEEVKKILQRFRDTHFKYLDQLEQTKAEYINDTQADKNKTKLRNALRKYLQYPLPDLKQTNLLNSPIFPFEVDFTIDGISGFRYGDVLIFDSIPKRYRKQTVFSIKGLSDTVSNDGIWQTKITCMMRPRVDMTEYEQYTL